LSAEEALLNGAITYGEYVRLKRKAERAAERRLQGLEP